MNAKIIFLSISLLNLSALAMKSDSEHKKTQMIEAGKRLLENAKQNQDVDTIRRLLDFGADVNTSDTDDITALMYGAIRGNQDLVELLIERKANVNHQDQSLGMTALMLAARCGHRAMIQLLLKHGADANLRNVDGRNALMLAAHWEHEICCEILFDAILELTPKQKKKAINARIDLYKIKEFMQSHKLK